MFRQSPKATSVCERKDRSDGKNDLFSVKKYV